VQKQVFLTQPHEGDLSMGHAKFGFVSSVALLAIGSAMPLAAAPVRKAQPVKAVANDPQLSAKTAAGAPFAKVVIDIVPEACGRLGCEVFISGVTAAGKEVDVTFTDILKNANLGTKAEMFGISDATGMPQIVLEQGLINGGSAFNLFAYKPTLRRYAFVRNVSGYAAGKIRGGTANAPAPARTPVAQTPEAMAQKGTFAFTGDPESACPAFNDGFARLARVRLYQAAQWDELRGTILAAGCGSDEAYEQLAETLYKQNNNAAAVVYFEKALAINQDKASPRILLCKKNGCGIDVKYYASSYIGRAKGLMGGTLVRASQQQLSQSQPVAVEPAVVNSGVWSLGRARFLVEPRGGCGPDVSLGTKSYCFNQAMDWLRRHPSRQSVDVVAMQNSWLPGSFVPHNNGQGWNIYKVSKQGNAFTAEKQRHYATKVQVPQGCIYAGVVDQAWYIGGSRRGKVAIEAANYACSNPWAGEPIYAAYLDTGDTDDMRGDIAFAQGAGPGRPSAQISGPTNCTSGNPAEPSRYAVPCEMVRRNQQEVRSEWAAPGATDKAGCRDALQQEIYIGLNGKAAPNPCPTKRKN
jgi:hypothetical protein